ncbi:MAG: NAD-dependent epimerase/dehydratase family protein [Planctomycetota bacterium]|nr:MAG: NAD-dependent epimerase/dehydratase family protein [Planctomycetota bacterium]
MESILITGGAGFVGSYLALKWKEKQSACKIKVLDNLRRRGSELNLPRLKKAGIEFFHGDIRLPEDLEQVGEVQLLVECSADPSVQAGVNHSPAYVIGTNLTGTVNCLEYARKQGANFLFLSTSRVYPIPLLRQIQLRETPTRFELMNDQNLPGVSEEGISEDFPLEGHRSFYGATKLASEHIIQEYVANYDLKAVINRCSVLAGSWQMGKVDQGVVSLWMIRHFFRQSLRYIGFGGTGKQVRDVLHLQDLFQLLWHQHKEIQQHAGKVYNVGGGRENSVSLRELTSLCEKYTGNSVEILPQPQTNPQDIPLYISDCRRVRNVFNWHPTVSIEEILEEIARWLRDYRSQLEYVFT